MLVSHVDYLGGFDKGKVGQDVLGLILIHSDPNDTAHWLDFSCVLCRCSALHCTCPVILREEPSEKRNTLGEDGCNTIH